MIFDKETDILKDLAEKKLISEHSVNVAEFLCWIEKNLKDGDLRILAATAALVSEWAASGSICVTKNDIEKFAGENKEGVGTETISA